MNTKMKPEIKEPWIAELRSGNIRQGYGVLHDARTDAMCCLGVLCHLAKQAGVSVDDVRTDTQYVLYDNCSGYLPESVQEWAGLTSSNPTVLEDELLTRAIATLGDGTLAKMNDDGFTFDQIADLIEAFL